MQISYDMEEFRRQLSELALAAQASPEFAERVPDALEGNGAPLVLECRPAAGAEELRLTFQPADGHREFLPASRSG